MAERSNQNEATVTPSMPKLPSTNLCALSEVDQALMHYLCLASDFDRLDDAEATDPGLWKAAENALTEARAAFSQVVEAQCANIVYRTLLLDRKHRQESGLKE